MTPRKQVKSRWTAFWFPADNDRWLVILRVGLGVQVIAFCLSLGSDWTYLLAGTGRGLLSRQLSEVSVSSDSVLIPRLGWLVDLGAKSGLSEVQVLWCAWGCLFAAALLICVGLYARASAVVAWFLHLCAVKSSGLMSYGMDNFTTIGLFYLMVSPLPDRWSADCWLGKSAPKEPEIYGFFRRILQLHLCIAYFFAGIGKFCGPAWWNGDSLWRSLTRPPFNVFPPEILLRLHYFLPACGILVFCLELGYPILIWPRRTRFLCLTAVIGMHIAIGIAMRMYLFALILIILNVSAFGPGSLCLLRRHRGINMDAGEKG